MWYYISSIDFDCNKTGQRNKIPRRGILYDRCGKWCSSHQNVKDHEI